MARPSKRRPPVRRASPDASGERQREAIPLQLSVTKAGLGLELVESIALGFLELEQLSTALVGLTFPVDLSGGVARFRHCRGALERFSLAARRDQMISALAPRLRGALGGASPLLSVADLPGGLTFGLVEGEKALAFDLLWAPSEADARWVVGGARALGLESSALAAALRAVDAMIGAPAVRSGAVLAFVDAPDLVLRQALPGIGARVPDTAGLRFGPLESSGLGFRIACDRAFAPPHLAPHVISELELARLAEQADTALAEGRLDDARGGYVSLLERSPRDGDVARRLADLDRSFGGRSEAALSTLLEAMPVAEAGLIAGVLLAATGHAEGAVLAFRQAAERESYGALASLALLRASFLANTLRERTELLDQAIARAPALEATRWARFEMRLKLSDASGAMADAEHLEAAARGAHRRQAVWQRAAEGLLAHGHHTKAITLFERALRYVPDHPAAMTGLARGLLLAGRTGRSLDLLARAVEISERKGIPAFGAVLALARALAESAADYSHAIARLRTIPPGHPESLDARALEGRYRAALGDLAGASIAFAKLRDAVELSKPATVESATAWLLEAARFERETQRDVHAAQRHLAVALELSPRNGKVLALFRQVSGQAVRPRNAPANDAGNDEERARVLSERVRANPADDAAVIELADLLARQEKDLELLALLSARLEDATELLRLDLLARNAAVLKRLIERARREGRPEEEGLYREALAKLS